MAMTNFSSDGTQAAFDRLLCSEETTAGIKDQLVFLVTAPDKIWKKIINFKK